MYILSFQFIIFVSVIYILSLFTRGKGRKLLILSANLLYLLSFGNLFHLIWLMAVILISYAGSLWIEKSKSRTSLILSIVPVVVSLLFFKYSYVFGLDNLIVPLGISFYTFKIISYLVDLYQKKDYVHGFLDYLIYVSFFPVFTAGPILRSRSFFEQLTSENQLNYQRMKNAAVQCAFGMFEKIVIADYLSIVCNLILDNHQLNGLSVAIGVILYSFHIYTDFDAYSNIAIGISGLLGFEIKRNFYTPYLSASIIEFWNRWHISLSSWLKDYIYIPLGGNRKGHLRKYLNIFCVFLVSGLWHGSTICFLIWGVGHGILNVIENVIKFACRKLKWFKFVRFFGKIFGIIINFSFVSFLWIFFRSSGIHEAVDVIQRMFVFNATEFNYELIGITVREGYWLIVLIATIIITDIFRNKTDMVVWLSKRNVFIRWTIYTLAIVLVIIFGVYGPGYNASDFIYASF